MYGEPQPLSDATQENATEETPAAAAQAARAAAPASQALTVNNGQVSGTAALGTLVTVTANAAPDGQRFAGWTGDIQILGNPSAATTTAIVPSTEVTITATYVED
jgi:Divergent InlB B-repeat domain